MRKFLIALALMLGILLILTQMAEVKEIYNTLRRGDWKFVIAALVVQAVWILNAGASYRSIFRALGIDEKLSRLALLSTAAEFVNVVAPSGGMGGITVFVADARRSGLPSGRVTVAGVLYILFDYLGFVFVLAVGLLVLDRRNNLNSAEMIASLILLVILGIMVGLLVLGMRSEQALGRVLAGMAHFVNRLLHPFTHRPYLSEERAHEFAHDAASGLHQMRLAPKSILWPVVYSLVSKSLLIVVLFLMFLAFQVPATVGTLVAGFSIGYLFLVVSPTPYGLGVVEGVLALALASLSVPLGAATVISLAYRGITFWVPLLVGLISLRWLHLPKKIETA